MAKKCPKGEYYCFTDKKCKKIPRGYHIGARGYLARDNRSDSGNGKNGNGNGSSNGNGNGGNGGGNGNGGSGGNGGGNGSGGVGESVVYEKSNPRIPRKKGQPAKSKKHSDLYTDEDPKGTIHGLGFKDVAKAKASVSKIRNSSRSHAHKIQAAVAMEQRAREMGKTSEAAVYRKYINSMKKKTKKMNEEKMTPAEKRKDTMLKKKYDKSDMKKSMQKQYGKEEGKKVYFATIRKQAMEGVEDDKYNVNEEGLRDWFGKSSGTTKSGRKVRGWVQVGGKYDGKPCARQPGQKSTPKCVSSSKRRSMSKKERDSAARRKRAADPNQPQKSGAAKPTNVSTDPKRKMKEEYVTEILGAKLLMKGAQRVGASTRKINPLPTKAAAEVKRNRARKLMRGEPVGKTTDPRLKEIDNPVPGGKYSGQSRLASIARGRAASKISGKKIGSKLKTGFKNEASRQRAQNKIRQERGLPTVGGITGKMALATVPGLAVVGLKQAFDVEKPSPPKGLSRKEIKKKYPGSVDGVRSRAQINKTGAFAEETMKKKKVEVKLNPKKKIGVKVTDIGAGGKEYVRKDTMNEAKDKKGKGSGTKDACYHKVKSRYSVWPSAYASGALVKCRKVGAANWGNKSKNEGFSPMQVAALEAAGMVEIKEGQKCWKGYEKKGTKMMFGKRYNNCVKKKSTKEEVEYTNEGVTFLKREKEKKKSKSEYLNQRDAGKLAKKKMAKKDQEKVNFLEPEETNESKTRLVKNGHTYKVVLTWRGKTYMVQMFVPSVSRPTRQEVEQEIQKLYPDAKVMSFLPRDLEPGEPTVMMGEEKRDEYGDIVGGPKISKKEKAKNLAKNEKDEQHTTTTSEAYSSKPSNLKKKAKLTAALNRLQDLKVKQKMSTEEVIHEDDMKGMSVKSGHKRPTKAGAGMTQKGVEAYRRRNPGSKLKTAVTGKVKKGSKAAKRRKSYCARSAGQMKKFPKAAKDPNSRLRQARRRWKC